MPYAVVADDGNVEEEEEGEGEEEEEGGEITICGCVPLLAAFATVPRIVAIPVVLLGRVTRGPPLLLLSSSSSLSSPSLLSSSTLVVVVAVALKAMDGVGDW